MGMSLSRALVGGSDMPISWFRKTVIHPSRAHLDELMSQYPSIPISINSISQHSYFTDWYPNIPVSVTNIRPSVPISRFGLPGPFIWAPRYPGVCGSCRASRWPVIRTWKKTHVNSFFVDPLRHIINFRRPPSTLNNNFRLPPLVIIEQSLSSSGTLPSLYNTQAIHL